MALWELEHFFFPQCQYHMYFSSLFSFNKLSVAMKGHVIIYNNRKPLCNADLIHVYNHKGKQTSNSSYQSRCDEV